MEQAEQAQITGFDYLSKRWPPLTIQDLAAARLRDGLPLWVVNTSVGYGGSALDWASGKKESFAKRNFEITPYGFGSVDGGFVDAPISQPSAMRDFSMLRAVSASAAFLDPQFQTMPPWQKVPAGSLMHLFNLAWGLDIPNPRVSEGHRSLHRLLPFPLYYLDGALPGQQSPFLHLSDGGHASDNLGIYALVRRGVRKIIAVDGGYDRDGRLDDLCFLRRALFRDHQMRLELDTASQYQPADKTSAVGVISHFDNLLESVCGPITKDYDSTDSSLRALPVFAWPNPVLPLRIVGVPEQLVPGGEIRVFLIKLYMDRAMWEPFTKPEGLQQTYSECSANVYPRDNPRPSTEEAVLDLARNPSLPCSLAVFQDINTPWKKMLLECRRQAQLRALVAGFWRRWVGGNATDQRFHSTLRQRPPATAGQADLLCIPRPRLLPCP